MSNPSLDSFHDAVAAWFRREMGVPTAPQRDGWPHILAGEATLIAAPTGSGKTLAAFLSAIDGLVRDGVRGELGDEARVLYVSPLKALGNDIQRNLEAPLAGIARELDAMGLPRVDVRTIVRMSTRGSPIASSSPAMPLSGASRFRWMSFPSAFSGDT